jgi:hypothetical protein
MTFIDPTSERSARSVTVRIPGKPSSSTMSEILSTRYSAPIDPLDAKAVTREISTRRKPRPAAMPAIRTMTRIDVDSAHNAKIATTLATGRFGTSLMTLAQSSSSTAAIRKFSVTLAIHNR